MIQTRMAVRQVSSCHVTFHSFGNVNGGNCGNDAAANVCCSAPQVILRRFPEYGSSKMKMLDHRNSYASVSIDVFNGSGTFQFSSCTVIDLLDKCRACRTRGDGAVECLMKSLFVFLLSSWRVW